MRNTAVVKLPARMDKFLWIRTHLYNFSYAVTNVILTECRFDFITKEILILQFLQNMNHPKSTIQDDLS